MPSTHTGLQTCDIPYGDVDEEEFGAKDNEGRNGKDSSRLERERQPKTINQQPPPDRR
jgi:hypothetical protein